MNNGNAGNPRYVKCNIARLQELVAQLGRKEKLVSPAKGYELLAKNARRNQKTIERALRGEQIERSSREAFAEALGVEDKELDPEWRSPELSASLPQQWQDQWQEVTEGRREISPFSVATPLVKVGQFFGRCEEIKRICGFLSRQPFQHTAIVGPRYTGKTWLLHYLMLLNTTPTEVLQKDRLDQRLQSQERLRWVFVDFHNPNYLTPNGLLRYLIESIGSTAPPTAEVGPCLDILIDKLKEQPAVMLFDELGSALEHGSTLDDRFWGGVTLGGQRLSGPWQPGLRGHGP